jgi:hypothetical protein
MHIVLTILILAFAVFGLGFLAHHILNNKED